jgi:F-type H+-transporting ATPase subunit epsilon
LNRQSKTKVNLKLSSMNLEIITPAENLYKGEVRLVKVPGIKSPFTVLRNHAPIISVLEKGTIKIISEENESSSFEISGGIIEVNRNKIMVLADIE